MEAISLKLPGDLLQATRRYAQILGVSRAAYIRRAIERMNRDTQTGLRAERLAAASKKACKGSAKVNAEFAVIETRFGPSQSTLRQGPARLSADFMARSAR